MVASSPQQAAAQAPHAAQPVDVESLKEQAKKLALGEHHSADSQASGPASAQSNGVNGVHAAHNGSNGSALPATNTEEAFQQVPQRGSPHGSGSPDQSPAYSQTGDFVGPGPEQVNANPANPSLPPPNVAKAIPCRFYPNCRYGDSCAFAHGADNLTGGAGSEGVPNGAVFGEHPMPFFNPYAPSPQPGMPPMDYYGAPIAPGYYGPPPPGPYQPNPYAPMPYYGGYYPGPPPQNGLPDAAAQPQSAPPAPTSSTEVDSSQAEPTSPAAPVSTPSMVSPETPAFVPLSSSVSEQPQQQQQQPAAPQPLSAFTHPVQQPGSNGVHQNGHDSAPRPPRGPNNALNDSINRRERGPYASSARTSIKGSAAKKPYQIACTFFLSNACRLGDACQFSHILQDGSDAKMQGRNIVGMDGRVGDASVLEEFKRTEQLRKERLAATGVMPQRPRPDGVPRPHGAAYNPNLPPHPNRHHQAQQHEGSSLPGADGHHFSNGYSGHHKKSFHGNANGRGRNLNQTPPAPRVPSGEDFPALPAGVASPRQASPEANGKPEPPASANGSTHSTPASTDVEVGSMALQSGQSTPQTPASTHEAAASVLPKLVSSFASAAARGASAIPPPPRQPARGKQQGNKNSKSAAAAAASTAPAASPAAAESAEPTSVAPPPAPPAAAEAVAA